MPQTKKIFTLDIDLDFLDNVYVLGIQAPLLPLHRLAYFLNERAQWNLTRVDDYSVHDATGNSPGGTVGGVVGGGAVGGTEMGLRPGGPTDSRQASEANQPEDESELYALLQHTLPLDRLNVFLLENKNPEPLVKAENCDYFLMACGETARYDFDALTAIVEGIESVFSVYPIDVRRHDALKRFFMIKKRFPEI